MWAAYDRRKCYVEKVLNFFEVEPHQLPGATAVLGLQLGWKVGSHLWLFLLLSMVLMAVLSTGLIYLPQDEDDDLEQQYTPVRSPAKAQQCFVQEHFTANNSLIFFISRKCTEVNYASILVVSNTETPLEPEIIEISKVEGAWQALTVTQDNRTQIPYSKVCTKNHRLWSAKGRISPSCAL